MKHMYIYIFDNFLVLQHTDLDQMDIKEYYRRRQKQFIDETSDLQYNCIYVKEKGKN